MYRRDGVALVRELEELCVGIHLYGSDEAGGEVEDKSLYDGHGDDFA